MQKSVILCYQITLMKQVFTIFFVLISTVLFSQSYENQWNEVYQYELNKHYKSANEKVLKIYNQAVTDKNDREIVKTFFYRSKFEQYLTTTDSDKVLKDLAQEVERVNQPYKSVLQTYKAKLLADYLLRNYYKINQLDKIVEPYDKNSLQNWRSADFIDEIESLYQQVFRHENLLKNANEFLGDLVDTESNADLKNYKVYELLCYEWITIFENNYLEKSKIPEDTFLNANEVLDFTNQFTTYQFPKPYAKVLNLYQKLETHYQSQNDKYKLDQIRLKRYQNFSEFLKIPFESKDLLLTTVFEAMQTRKFQSKVLVEKIYLWYSYGEMQSAINKSKAQLAWTKTVEYILSLKKYELTEKETDYIETIYYTITDKKTQTNFPKYLLKNKTDKAWVRLANTDTLYTRFYKLEHIKTLERLKNDSLKIDFIQHKKPVYEYVTAPLNKENNHFEKQYEFLIDGVEKGVYLVLTSPNQQFNSTQKYFDFHDVVVTDVVLFYKAEAQSVDFYFLDRKTGKPFVNHPVKINRKKHKTNDLGIVSIKKSKRIKNEDKVKKTEFLVQFQDEDFLFEEVCDFDEEELVYNYQNIDYRYEGKEIIISTFADRKLYKPGQTIYFKGVAVSFDQENLHKKIASNLRLLAVATDNNGAELYKKEFTTNEFGSFADSLVIPQKDNISRVIINFRRPESLTKKEEKFWEQYDDISSRAYLYVEEYKRPTFSVSLDHFDENVTYGQEITLTGKVQTHAKTPISNANVETIITYNSFKTSGSYYYDSYDSGDFPKIESTTDADGSFSVKIQLKDVPKDSLHFRPAYQYTIKTNVKDASGETQSTYANIVVNHNDLEIYCGVNEREIFLDSDVVININPTNANRKFKPVSGTLKIVRNTYDNRYFKDRLWEAPKKQLIPRDVFQKHFPHESYEKADTELQNSVEVYSEKIQVTEEKKPVVIKKPDWLLEGSYKVRFIPDEKFEADSLLTHFEVKDPNGIPAYGDVVSLSLEGSVIEDNHLKVEVNAVFEDVLVFVQVQQNYNILPVTSFISKKGISEVQLPLLNKDVQSVFVSYYYVYDNRVYEDTVEQTFYKQAKKPAQIEIVHLKNRLLPGAKEQILLKVTDENQQPFAGEMVSSMYDLSAEYLMKNSTYAQDWRLYAGNDYYNEEFSYLMFDEAINRGEYLSRDYWKIRLSSQLNIPFPKINTFGFDLYEQYNGASVRKYYEKLVYKVVSKKPEDGMIELSGSVFDADFLDPLPGAAVIIQSSNIGTETNMNGGFTLFAYPDDLIKISLTGFEEVTFLAKDFKNPVLIHEDRGADFLEEMVISSYTTTVKNDLSNFSVISHIVNGRPNATFIQTLQAQVPGINISTGSGEPGADTSVVLRGLGSVNGSAQPLYIVDGVPVSAERFRSLSPDDISNISLLKDAGATAIYGNRGANGVILISTKKGNLSDMSDVKIRKNLKETAFFYPYIYPNKDNVYEINYTVPESLTEWKFRAFTHNKNLEFGYLETNVYTQKDVTIQPNMPRFLRENDEVILRARVSNVSEELQQGKVSLQLKDALTEEILDNIIISENLQDIQIKPNSSTFVEWKVNVPQDIQGLQYVVVVKTIDYSDGEQAVIPVLSKKQLVSENVSLWQLGDVTKQYRLSELNVEDEKYNLSYRIQASTNGLWLMMQKLPYLLKYEHECTEQLMSKYFANQLALKIVEENEDVQKILSEWRKGDETKWDNDEQLKEIIDKESPWLSELLSEKERNQKFASYFDADKLNKTNEELVQKITDRQANNGGFGWFSDDNDDWWITLQFLQTVKQLNEMDLPWDRDEITQNAVKYLDDIILEKLDLSTVSNQKIMDYLYVRTHFKKQFPVSFDEKWNELLKIVKKNWLDAGLAFKSKAAIVLENEGENDVAQQIIKQLQESSIIDESKGMYWKNEHNNISFWNSPVEEQSFAIEAFVKNNKDKSDIQSLKARLINQSNYDNFGSTKATVQAVYAYLLGLEKSKLKSEVKITDKKDQVLQPKDSLLADSGIYEIAINRNNISTNLNEISIENKGETPLTGSISYNYLQDLDKISATNNDHQPFSIQKDYFRETEGKRVVIDDAAPLKIGEEVWVRLKFTTSENASYVHIKDMRASTFEPFFELSGMRFENDLRYYFKSNDTSTNFFIDYLPVGDHVLWYRVKVNNIGKFTDGLTTMQSMYAPQYQAHSKGVTIEVQ